MKERSKEKMAELLMEELLEQLKEREAIKRKLGDMTALPVEELIEQLLDEFEHIVEKRRVQSVEESKARKDRRLRPEETPHPSELQEPPPASTGLITPPPRDVAQPPSQPSAQALLRELRAREDLAKEMAPPDGTGPGIEKLSVEFPPIPLYIPSLDDTGLESRKDRDPGSRPEVSKPAPVIEKSVEQGDSVASFLDRKRGEKPKEGGEVTSEAETLKQAPATREDVSITSRPGAGDESDKDVELWEESEGEEESDELEDEMVLSKKTTIPKPPYQFADTDHVYLHAVAVMPEGETASAQPYMLEEKGIDDRNFGFALEYEGMRFYLSKFNPENMSVSKKGVLLLGKQETLQLQGVHESILNDLRIHGVLLPFKFGTVARGKDHLLGLIDDHLRDLRDALAQTAATKWWTLGAYVLDSRIAQLVGPQPATRGREREQHRVSYSQPALTKKYDVKTLERMLQKEKKLAESVHEEIKKYAERSDIDLMVSLGSGSSEDWKPILKASYEVAGRSLRHFNRAVTDLQYHHIMFDLMLSLTGDKEYFSFE
jgi:hypothetical protein